MGNVTLTKLRFVEGVWHGVLTQDDPTQPAPEIKVTHLDRIVPSVEVVEGPAQGNWAVRVPIPREALSDGVHTFVIRDGQSDEVLDSFTLAAGDPLASDIISEVSLLREELDMLKRAFRRHCLEPDGDSE